MEPNPRANPSKGLKRNSGVQESLLKQEEMLESRASIANSIFQSGLFNHSFGHDVNTGQNEMCTFKTIKNDPMKSIFMRFNERNSLVPEIDPPRSSINEFLPKKSDAQENLNRSLQGEEKSCFYSLKNLYDFLCDLFVKKPINERDIRFSNIEFQIVTLILKRKLGKNMNNLKEVRHVKDLNVPMIVNTVTHMQIKRPEERQKFIFSRAIKNLMKRFENIRVKREEAEKDFYNFYFKEVSDKEAIPLEEFFNPITSRGGSTKPHFNQKYFQKVFKSPNFLRDFVEYVEKYLCEEYRLEIRKKLEILLRKWDREDPSKIDIEEIKKYLISNKKCKLPWTIDEVRHSIINFLSLIRELNPQANISIDDFVEQT